MSFAPNDVLGLLARMANLWPGWTPPVDLADRDQVRLLVGDWQQVFARVAAVDVHEALTAHARAGDEWPPRPGVLAADARQIAQHRAARERGLPAADPGVPVTGDELRALLADFRQRLRSTFRRPDE